MKHRRLQELGQSDFEVVDGQPDIRGWDVKNAAGETIGEVDELILDAQARKVRYMVVDLDDDALDLEDDRKVLIPIGIAQLHEDDDDVLLQNVTAEQLRQLPEYDEDRLDAEVERAICTALGRTATGTAVSSDLHNSDFYEHDHFNDRNLYQRRLPQITSAGAALENRSMDLRERNRLGGDVEGNFGSSQDFDQSRPFDREGSYRGEEMEEDSLLHASNDRTGSEENLLYKPLDDDRSDDSLDRDNERRTRDRDNIDPVI